MLSLKRIFKNYKETGSLNERVNLYGFIGPEVFLTKTGEVGLILEVRGVDYECLDGTAIDGLTKRLESALKLFGDDYRIYQYLFKRDNETIPYKLYGNPVVDAAIQNRIAYLGSKADTLFSLSIYYVILHQVSQISHSLGNALAQFSNHGAKSVHLAAPGKDILTTALGNDYEQHSGTSMAAPFVAGSGIAIPVKLARALWIVPLALGTAAAKRSRSKIHFPWFIVFFVVAAVINTYVTAISPLSDSLFTLGRHGLAATLFLIGTGISRATLRNVGWRPLLQGILLWIVVGSASLYLIRVGFISF